MKKRYVKLLAMFLSAAVAFTALPVTGLLMPENVWAEEEGSSDNEEGGGGTTDEEETTNYTVTFDSQGGSAVEAATTSEGKVTKPATDPTKDGYTFLGWFADAASETEFDFDNTTLTENTTLYAKWEVAADAIIVKVGNLETTQGTAPTLPATGGYEFVYAVPAEAGQEETGDDSDNTDAGLSDAAIEEAMTVALKLVEGKTFDTVGVVEDAVTADVEAKAAEGEEGQQEQGGEEEETQPVKVTISEQEYTVFVEPGDVTVKEKQQTSTDNPKPDDTTTTTPDNNNNQNNNSQNSSQQQTVQAEAQSVSVSYKGSDVNGKTLALKKGAKYNFTAEVLPAEAVNKQVTWATSNEKVATVDANGQVKGKKAGKATITVTTANGKSASFKVKVQKDVVKVKKVKITAETKKIKKGQKLQLKAEVTPATAKNAKLTWKSSNTKVAKVNSKGVVTGKKKGKATITATSKDGTNKKASIKITVK